MTDNVTHIGAAKSQVARQKAAGDGGKFGELPKSAPSSTSLGASGIGEVSRETLEHDAISARTVFTHSANLLKHAEVDRLRYALNDVGVSVVRLGQVSKGLGRDRGFGVVDVGYPAAYTRVDRYGEIVKPHLPETDWEAIDAAVDENLSPGTQEMLLDEIQRDSHSGEMTPRSSEPFGTSDERDEVANRVNQRLHEVIAADRALVAHDLAALGVNRVSFVLTRDYDPDKGELRTGFQMRNFEFAGEHSNAMDLDERQRIFDTLSGFSEISLRTMAGSRTESTHYADSRENGAY